MLHGVPGETQTPDWQASVPLQNRPSAHAVPSLSSVSVGQVVLEPVQVQEPARVQELVTRAPYHQWLGLKVVALHDDGIELTAKWREEWVVSLERRFSHGGVQLADKLFR